MNAICKRIIDVTLASIGLVIATPLMALIAIAVWLNSPGNVIFAHERLGLHGKRFRMYKFRKFPANWGNKGPGVTVRNDVRMTRVGAILERTKLDELPQLWNVLKGDMSLVGPRPESTDFADLYIGKYAEILEYIPGIFGPNQAAFRNEGEFYGAHEDPETFYRTVLFPQKAQRDLAYFRKANCINDVTFISKGVWATLVGFFNWKRFMYLHSKILLADILLIGIAWVLGNVFCFSGIPIEENINILISGLVFIPPLLVIGMAIGGCYRYPVSYFSLQDAVRLAITTSVLWLLIFMYLANFHRDIPLYLAPIVGTSLITFLIFPRVTSRIRQEKTDALAIDVRRRIAIYGVGRAGLALADLIGNGSMVGFLDNDPNLVGRQIKGHRVLGQGRDIPTIHQVYHLDEVWLTFQPNKVDLSHLEKLCESQSISLLVLSHYGPLSEFVAVTDRVSQPI